MTRHSPNLELLTLAIRALERYRLIVIPAEGSQESISTAVLPDSLWISCRGMGCRGRGLGNESRFGLRREAPFPCIIYVEAF